MRLTLSLEAFRWVFVGFIVIASAATLVEAWPSRPLLAALASIEIAAALLFISPRWDGFAGTVLLGIFAIAFLFTGIEGGNPARFVYYAATVLVLWRPTAGRPSVRGEPEQL